MEALFKRYVNSEDTLQVYKGGKRIFRSREDGLRPLVDYIQRFLPETRGVVVFDRIVGNAAALLLKRASCREVYSCLGSEIAIRTLRKQKIHYHFTGTVPHILNQAGDGMCPMERLSVQTSLEEFLSRLGLTGEE